MNGRSAVMTVGFQFPYGDVTGVDRDPETGVITFGTSIKRTVLGLQLGITPQISSDGIVTLHIVPTITRIQGEEKVELPDGYYIRYGGQFESQRRAMGSLKYMLVLVIAGIFVLLFFGLGSMRLALMVMLNIPLALVGGILTVYLAGGVLSVSSVVGLIHNEEIAQSTTSTPASAPFRYAIDAIPLV